jgi:hypothetical protein
MFIVTLDCQIGLINFSRELGSICIISFMINLF